MKLISSIIIFSLILLCNAVFSQNIEGIIIYKKDMSTAYNQIVKKFDKYRKTRPTFFKDVMDMETRAYTLSENVKFYLKFNKDESLFKAENILEIENDKSYGLVLGPEGNGLFYSNKQESLWQLDAYGEKFIIKNEPVKWQLTNETKKVGNYTCYKATTLKITNGRKGIIKTPVIAWYAPEIAIPFGPLGYGNLPGLILELEIYDIKYYAVTINLNPNEKFKIEKPTKGKIVTQNEFDKTGKTTMQSFKKGF